ncbi:MAG: sensor domain-containing protein [Acidimicrobiales bacterium]
MDEGADPALEAVRRSLLLDVLEGVPDGAIVIGPDQTILWCNQSGAELLRRNSPAEVVGRPLVDISVPTALDEATFLEQWARLWNGEALTQELTTLWPGGEQGNIRVGRTPLRDEAGNVVAILSLAFDRTEEIQAKQAAVESEERLSAMFCYSSDIAIVFRRSGRITFVSASVERLTGWRPADLIGKNGWDFLHPDDLAADIADVTEALLGGRPITREWRMRRVDGSYGWFEQTLNDFTHVPAIGGVIGNFRDVTQRHEADKARRQSELILRRVIEVTNDAFLGIDRDGMLTEWNRAAEQMFGWPASEAIGSELASLILPEDSRRLFCRLISHLMEGRAKQLLHRPFETVAQSRAGRVFPVEVSVVEVTVGESSQFRAFVRDIAERKATEARLAQQAVTDVLTGLPNRVLLRDRLARAVARLNRHQGSVWVLFLDLDRFKLVNDGLGHDAGDELLKEVALRLQRTLRDIDTVARYGGDEFVMIVEGSTSEDEVRRLADRILESLVEPLILCGREIRPRASIGISVAVDGALNPDDLVRNADIAMYRAKEYGGQRAEMFESLMESRAVVRFELERDLTQAIAASAGKGLRADAPAGHLCVHYQPVVGFDGRVSGVEALVRWEHPVYGLMSPLEFIPLAEETGLILPLGLFVLETAARQVATWREGLVPELSVSVNVSARQLDDATLVGSVARVLADTGLAPGALCLELTETAFLRDSGRAATTLESLRALGVRLAVDDFGTGYSSLVYLRRLPVQVVKLDRTFVSGVSNSREDAAIVSAVINLAHALGMESVAEGVETTEQRDALDSLGCELAQGFFWSPPVPAADLTELLLNDMALSSTIGRDEASICSHL